MNSQRRQLRHELLESRQLLAADVEFSPWTNPIDPSDTTADGIVTARDALVIINQLSRSDTFRLAEIASPPILGLTTNAASAPLHLDATGDGMLTARDALRVINHLSRQTGAARLGEGEAVAAADAALSQFAAEGSGVETIEFSNNPEFAGTFGRIAGTLSGSNREANYRFIATEPRVTIDLNSVADEAIAVVRVFDDEMNEIASTWDQPDRMRFEGIDVVTRAGSEYFVSIQYADVDAASPDDFQYALSVYQFEPSRWLPSSVDEVIFVGGEGDLADTIEEAANISIRSIGSSFEQSLETAGDVDVIRLPNGLPGSIFVSGLDGIRFELLNQFGETLERRPLDTQLRADQDLGYYEADQGAAIGEESIYLKIESTTQAVGSYNVSILLDGAPPDDTVTGSVLDDYADVTASSISFTDGVAVVSGRTSLSGQVDFFRFSTGDVVDAFRARFTLTGDEGIQMQVFNGGTRTELTSIVKDSVSTPLPGRYSDTEHEIVLAVWNPRQASDYEVRIDGYTPPTSPDDLDEAVLATAVPLPDRDPTTGRLVLNVAANEVNLYRFNANVDSTRIIGRGMDGPDEAIPQLEVAFFDAAGRKIDGTYPENMDQIQPLIDRLQMQAVFADTEVGQEVFLRIANPLGQSVEFQAVIV